MAVIEISARLPRCPNCGDEPHDPDLECGLVDLGTCAYYQRTIGTPGFEDGICSFGCRDEPSCVTSEPSDGWPSQQPDGVVVQVNGVYMYRW